jgi:DNA-binding Lrp family transcriptional regulator
MQLYDEGRIKVLEALLAKNAVKPNIQQLKTRTKMHKSTLKSSLAFLEQQGVVHGYGPKIDFRRLGYKLEVTTLMQVDLSQRELFNKFLDRARQDPHMYWLSGLLASSNYNIIARHIYSDVESFWKHMQEYYYEQIPDLYSLIRDKQIFFTTEPVYKSESRTKSIIQLIKHARGME